MLYQEQEVSGNPDPVTLMSYYLSGRKGSLNRTYTPSMINNNNKELTLMLFYFLNTDPSNKKVIVINTVLWGYFITMVCLVEVGVLFIGHVIGAVTVLFRDCSGSRVRDYSKIFFPSRNGCLSCQP